MENSDLVILKALTNRNKFNMLGIPEPPLITKVSYELLQYYLRYFNNSPSAREINFEALKSLINLKSTKEEKELLLLLSDRVANSDIPNEALEGVGNVLAQMKMSGEIASIVTRFEQGLEVDLRDEISAVLEKYKGEIQEDDFISSDIDSYIEAKSTEGITWTTVRFLGEYIMPLRPGSSVLVAARPETGKTSFLCQTAVDFAVQAKRLYDHPVIILCNEETAERYPLRLYTTALRLPESKLRKLHDKGLLKDEYTSKTGLPLDFIKLKNIHGYTMAKISDLVSKVKPSVVILDLMANVKTQKRNANGAELLESLWIDWREMLVKNNCIGVAASQLHGDADGMLYPDLKYLQGSRTGVQGAVDVAIMLGKSTDSDIRGLAIVKNKFKVEGRPEHINSNLRFNPDLCLFS